MMVLAKAAGERWPISEQTRREVVNELTKLALGKNQSTRTRLAAMRAMIAADRLNAEVERERDGGDLFADIALEAAQAGVTVQAIVE